ncbi:MAG: hypothetical protein AAF664_19530 [Planctomycetota bacterium]
MRSRTQNKAVGVTPQSHGEDSPESQEIAAGQSSAAERRSLVEMLPGGRMVGGEDVEFISLCTQSEMIMPGDLAVCRIGQDNPVRLVANAMARGAAGVITEQLLPCPLPQYLVGDVDAALLKIKRETLDRPDRKMLTVGVLGGAGKTVTTLMVATMLRGCGIRTAYQCDLGHSDSGQQKTGGEAHAGGIALLDWLVNSVEEKSDAAIVELTDESLRRGAYDVMEFDVLIVASPPSSKDDFGPGTLDCALEHLGSDGIIIASADEPGMISQIEQTCPRVVTFGLRNEGDVTAKLMDQEGGVWSMLVDYGDTSAMVETTLGGPGMNASFLAATTMGILIDQPIQHVVEQISRLRQVPGRLQKLERDLGQPTVILDSNEPNQLRHALRYARMAKGGGQLWVVAAVGDQDESSLAIAGHLMERFADRVVLTSAVSVSAKQFRSAAHNVIDGVQKCAAMRWVADTDAAVRWAIDNARPGDTVLLAVLSRDHDALGQRKEIRSWENRVARIHQAQAKPKVSLGLVN